MKFVLLLLRLLMVVSLLFAVLCASAEDRKTALVRELLGTDEDVARGFDEVGDRFLGILDTFVLDGDHDNRTGRVTSAEGRKKKYKKLNKYVLPLLVGFLIIKSVLLPLALKALAILSGSAIVLSLMSLILAAIVGLRSIASSFSNKIDHFPKYRRKDWPEPVDQSVEDPYNRYPYAERTRRRRRRKR